MTLKESVVYFGIATIFAPFTYLVFLNRPETEISTMLIINFAYFVNNIYIILATKYELTHINIHKEKDRKARQRTRVYGQIIYPIATIITLVLFFPMMSNFNFSRLIIYIIPIIIIFFILKFKYKLEQMRYVGPEETNKT